MVAVSVGVGSDESGVLSSKTPLEQGWLGWIEGK